MVTDRTRGNPGVVHWVKGPDAGSGSPGATASRVSRVIGEAAQRRGYRSHSLQRVRGTDRLVREFDNDPSSVLALDVQISSSHRSAEILAHLEKPAGDKSATTAICGTSTKAVAETVERLIDKYEARTTGKNKSQAVMLNIDVKIFVTTGLQYLSEDHSRLCVELLAAPIDVATMQHQFQVLSEATATRSGHILRAALTLVGATLQTVASSAIGDVGPVTMPLLRQPMRAGASAKELHSECEDLIWRLDHLSDWWLE